MPLMQLQERKYEIPTTFDPTNPSIPMGNAATGEFWVAAGSGLTQITWYAGYPERNGPLVVANAQVVQAVTPGAVNVMATACNGRANLWAVGNVEATIFVSTKAVI